LEIIRSNWESFGGWGVLEFWIGGRSAICTQLKIREVTLSRTGWSSLRYIVRSLGMPVVTT